MPARPYPVEPRFWGKVEKVEGGCWLWMAGTNRKGYGRFALGRTNVSAQKFAWKLSGRVLAKHKELHHFKCENKLCVNPAHLKLVTHEEHVRIHRLSRIRCVNGHRLSGENLYVAPGTGARSCRICRRDATVRRYSLTK